MNAPAPAAVKPKRRRWPWAVAAVLLVLGLPVGYWLYWSSTTGAELAALEAELDRTDPGWRWEDLQARRASLPDERNAALRVLKIRTLLSRAGFLGQDHEKAIDIPNAAQMPVPHYLKLREAMEAAAEARAEARLLKDLPEGRHHLKYAPDIISTVITPLQETREVMHFLQFDASLRAQEGDAAGAVESCRALLNAARSIGDEPTLVAYLVRCAGQAIAVVTLERVLAQGEPPEAELRRMQGLLEREAAEDLLGHALRGERAIGVKVHEALRSGKLAPGAVIPPGGSGWTRLADALVPLSLDASRLAHLRLMTQAVEASKLPDPDRGDTLINVDAERVGRLPLLARGLVPAVSKVGRASLRTRAQLRCAAAAVAAERYRAREGRWPAALDDLVTAGLLKAVPADPYDGRPLRWKATPSGRVVYSDGPDRTDNGGAVNPANPTAPNADLGFRLWDVPTRRQPHPPLPVVPTPSGVVSAR